MKGRPRNPGILSYHTVPLASLAYTQTISSRELVAGILQGTDIPPSRTIPRSRFLEEIRRNGWKDLSKLNGLLSTNHFYACVKDPSGEIIRSFYLDRNGNIFLVSNNETTQLTHSVQKTQGYLEVQKNVPDIIFIQG